MSRIEFEACFGDTVDHYYGDFSFSDIPEEVRGRLKDLDRKLRSDEKVRITIESDHEF